MTGVSGATPAARVRTNPWVRRLALGIGLWLVYLANGREIGAGDTVPAILLPIGIARGDGVVLDRFTAVLHFLDPGLAEPGKFPPYYASIKRGHLMSRYPVMPSLIAFPLVSPQVAYLDVRRPGWDATPASTLWYARRMAKNASAAIAALTGVLLLEVLLRLGLARVALPATIVAALGSPLWVVAAQSPWPHGPAALLLTTAILLLLDARGRATLVGAAFTLALMVVSRVPSVVFAVPLVAWALWREPGSAWCLLGPLAIVGAPLVGYNLLVFGTPVGGQLEIESMRLPLHAVSGSWGSFTAGAMGTLVSPSRGLLVFCPWVVATILALPAMRARLVAAPILAPLMFGLVLHFLVFATYSAWWAGWCFGPRYWTEAVPVLGILYAFALDTARTRACWAKVPLYGAGVLAIGVHALGAVSYPSTWNATPANVDLHHERLWDWRDSELTRELREGSHPPEFRLVPW